MIHVFGANQRKMLISSFQDIKGLCGW